MCINSYFSGNITLIIFEHTIGRTYLEPRIRIGVLKMCRGRAIVIIQQCCRVYFFQPNSARDDILLHHVNNSATTKLTLGHKSVATRIYSTVYRSFVKILYLIIHMFIREVFKNPHPSRKYSLISVVVVVYKKELLQSIKYLLKCF